ncbi:MAG: hypothetical protein M3Y84_12690 [Acidobacteriota bacterium]|nr:hypothetical protein [Acidobacteriota bacterium]
MTAYYQTEKEIQDVIENFESCITGKDNFGHYDHLTVAVWYLRNSTSDQAFEKMRFGLLRFLDHHAVSRAPYSDQLTMSWINLVQSVIKQTDPDLSLVEVTNIVLDRLGHSRIVLEQDSQGCVKEVVQEDQANSQSE